MRRSHVAALGVALIVAVVAALSCRQGPALSRLRVVYAGDPGAPQTESFRKLLAGYVRSVTVVPVLDLAKIDLSDADVLIVGGRTMGKADGKMKMQPGPQGVTLDTLAIPTVLIGGMGARVADSLDLKLGWRHG